MIFFFCKETDKSLTTRPPKFFSTVSPIFPEYISKFQSTHFYPNLVSSFNWLFWQVLVNTRQSFKFYHGFINCNNFFWIIKFLKIVF